MTVRLYGKPNPKQKAFFQSTAPFTAYGGARGGGKSWALRRKLVLMCLRYPGIRCLLVRRTYGELKNNHVLPFLSAYKGIFTYKESAKRFDAVNGSTIQLGYCHDDGDLGQYQGQEYDVIALDEATQLTEHQFSVLSACLRGANDLPKRMYLTCNPGGVGHAWVKRLFIDRRFHDNENPEDYAFIPATVYDNEALLHCDDGYVRRLSSLSPKLRSAWLDGDWSVFEGQFFPDLDERAVRIPHDAVKEKTSRGLGRYFMACDYGFDLFVLLLLYVDGEGKMTVVDECRRPGLTITEAGEVVRETAEGIPVDYLVASPDLWNRRQDTGRSGFEILSAIRGVPPLIRADDRRVPGWRVLREFLSGKSPALTLDARLDRLWQDLCALTVSDKNPDDASSSPHDVTHAPEALRYAVMSRPLPVEQETERLPFTFR